MLKEYKMKNKTSNLSMLFNCVNNLNNKIDPRWGRYFKIKAHGTDDKGMSRVILTLNAQESNVIERPEIRSVLDKFFEDFIKTIKAEFREKSGDTLQLKNESTDYKCEAVNYAGSYIVTLIKTFETNLIG